MRKAEQHRRTASTPACLRRRFSLSNLSNRARRSCCSHDAIRLLLPQIQRERYTCFRTKIISKFRISDCGLRISDCGFRIAKNKFGQFHALTVIKGYEFRRIQETNERERPADSTTRRNPAKVGSGRCARSPVGEIWHV